MQLSIILVSYDMAREIPRTLRGLSRTYQQGAESLDYEVLLLDNGSPQPLDEASWGDVDVPVKHIRIADAPPSPAHAINVGLQQAQGEVICLMIDGAHLLTPGVFRTALANFTVFDQAVVATRYFWLGPESQNLSIADGYCQAVEDRLLQKIDWPSDGYRLFEIGTPLLSSGEQMFWTNRLFESNCIFIPRQLFLELGGADERFDFPGGGFVNADIFKRAVESDGTTPVQLIGEGCFHQIHGGTTTNVGTDRRDSRLEEYLDQYERIRGDRNILTDKSFYFFGHIPNNAAKIHRWNKKPWLLKG